MKNCILIPTLILTYALASAAIAQTNASEVSISAGVRTWMNDWQGNSTSLGSNNQKTLLHMNSGTTVSIIPFALIRYRDFGISASTMLPQSYSASDGLKTETTTRQEYDVNLLYYFTPSVSVSAGYKSVKWFGFDVNGLTMAVSASAPVSEKFGMYGTLGLGKLESQRKDVAGTTSGDYYLLEAGLSYSLGSIGSVAKASAVTFGYRQQRLKFLNVFIGNPTNVDAVNDNTSGFTLGIVASF